MELAGYGLRAGITQLVDRLQQLGVVDGLNEVAVES